MILNTLDRNNCKLFTFEGCEVSDKTTKSAVFRHGEEMDEEAEEPAGSLKNQRLEEAEALDR